VFAEGGWAPTVADGGFTHEYSAPSAGPPPLYVYEFTPGRRVRRVDQGARRRHSLDLDHIDRSDYTETTEEFR
jgi:hypothetical protein